MTRTTRRRPPRRASYPAAPGWLNEPLAHRGLHGPGDGTRASEGSSVGDASSGVAQSAPLENTLEAFAAARDAGYGVELDVHLSADGIPVVHHDALLADGRSLASLEQAALPADVATLTAALDVLRTVPVMVEIKQTGVFSGALARATAELLDTHSGPMCVASFHPGTIAWFMRNRPGIVRVFAATDEHDAPVRPVLRRRLANLEHLALLRPHAVSFDVRSLPTPATARWREEGGLLTTWTVDDEATLEAARAHADGIIFEGLRP